MTDAWSLRHERRLLQRHGAVTRQLDHILCVNSDRSSRRAGANARRTAFEACADITFDGSFHGFDGFDPPQTLEQGELLLLLRHLDDAVGAILFTIATPDTRLVDKDFAVGESVDRRGRAISHTVRMLAVPARGGQMQ